MLKTLSLAAALALCGAGSALALTLPQLPVAATVGGDGAVTLVRDGCGPGGWRDGYGACHGYRPVYRPRACPWGWHLGPYGQRCFRN